MFSQAGERRKTQTSKQIGVPKFKLPKLIERDLQNQSVQGIYLDVPLLATYSCGKSLYKPYIMGYLWLFLLGVHPIVP